MTVTWNHIKLATSWSLRIVSPVSRLPLKCFIFYMRKYTVVVPLSPQHRILTSRILIRIFIVPFTSHASQSRFRICKWASHNYGDRRRRLIETRWPAGWRDPWCGSEVGHCLPRALSPGALANTTTTIQILHSVATSLSTVAS